MNVNQFSAVLKLTPKQNLVVSVVCPCNGIGCDPQELMVAAPELSPQSVLARLASPLEAQCVGNAQATQVLLVGRYVPQHVEYPGECQAHHAMAKCFLHV